MPKDIIYSIWSDLTEQHSSVNDYKKESIKKEVNKSYKKEDTMSEMSTSTRNTTSSSKSSVSQISINNNLAKKLNYQLKNKKSNEISIDQISFGSNKKR